MPVASYLMGVTRTHYLVEAVQSVLDQDEDVELVIADRTGRARDMLPGDRRIRYISRRFWGGSATANDLTFAASSSVHLPMADDDIAMPCRTRLTLAALDDGHDIVTGHYQEFDCGSILHLAGVYDRDAHLRRGLNMAIMASGYRRAVQRWDERYEHLADYVWWTEAMGCGCSHGVIDAVVMRVRIWPGQQSQRMDLDPQTRVEVEKERRQFLADYGETVVR